MTRAPAESLRDTRVMLVGARLADIGPVEAALHASGATVERIHPRDHWRWWFYELKPDLLIVVVTAAIEDGGLTPADLIAADLAVRAPVLALATDPAVVPTTGISATLTAPYRGDMVAAHAARLIAREQPAVSLHSGEVALDADGTRAWIGGQPVSLTPTEYALLACLVANPARVLTYGRLRAEVWPKGDAPTTRGLAVHLTRLRAKLAATESVRITTMRGVGYRLEVP
jgi:two-component system, OmpR family, response regulator MtrA